MPTLTRVVVADDMMLMLLLYTGNWPTEWLKLQWPQCIIMIIYNESTDYGFASPT